MGRLLKVLGGLVLVLVVLVGGTVFFLDSIAASAISTGAELATGVPSSVDRVRIGLISGRFDLTGLEIGNPEGYTTPHFFRLSHLFLELPLRSLLSDTVEVRELVIEGVDLTLERKGRTTNANEILTNLGAFEESDSEASGPELVIGRVVVRDVSAHVHLIPGQGERAITVEVPELIINPGGKSLNSAELVKVLIVKTVQAVSQKGGGVLGALSGSLRSQLSGLDTGGITAESAKSLGRDTGGKAKDSATEALKGLNPFGKD